MESKKLGKGSGKKSNGINSRKKVEKNTVQDTVTIFEVFEEMNNKNKLEGLSLLGLSERINELEIKLDNLSDMIEKVLPKMVEAIRKTRRGKSDGKEKSK